MNLTFKTIKNKAKFALITYKFENLIEIKSIYLGYYNFYK